LTLKPLRSALALAACALCSLAFSACGGGGDDEDATALLERAFSENIGSANVAMDIEFAGKGSERLGDDPVRVKVTGPYKSNGNEKLPSLDFDVNVQGAGQNLALGAVLTDDNGFIEFNGSPYEVGKEVIAQQNSALATESKEGEGLKALGIDPQSWVKDPSNEGEEEVAGVETKHLSGKVDVAKLLEDLGEAGAKAGGSLGGQAPPMLTEEQRKQAAEAVEDPKFDIYVGKDDNKIRRLSVDLSFIVPEDRRQSAGGLEGGSLAFNLELSGVGDEVKIEAPADAKPIAELVQGLQSLGGLGALSGGAGGSAPPAPEDPAAPTDPSAPAPPPGGGEAPTAEQQEQFERYAQCVQEADPTDAEAIEMCGKLLQPAP